MPKAHGLAVALAMVLSSGCGSSSGDPTAASSSPSGKPAGAGQGKALCDKAQSLHDRLAAVDTKVARIATHAHLPTSDDGTSLPPDTAVLEVSDDITKLDPPRPPISHLELNGQLVRGPSEVETELERRPGRVLVLALDAQAKVTTLPSFLDGLRDGIQVYVVASPKGAKREPPPAVLGKDADNPDPNQRAMAFSNLLKKSTASCKPAEKVFSSLANMPHESQIRALQTDLPAAIDSCGCKVDDDFVSSIVYLVGGDAPVVAKKMVLSKDAKAKKISVTDLDGQKLYDALPADGSPIHLTP